MDIGFRQEPHVLLDSIHQDSIRPFADLCDLSP
jgi:hypothetical protein